MIATSRPYVFVGKMPAVCSQHTRSNLSRICHHGATAVAEKEEKETTIGSSSLFYGSLVVFGFGILDTCCYFVLQRSNDGGDDGRR